MKTTNLLSIAAFLTASSGCTVTTVGPAFAVATPSAALVTIAPPGQDTVVFTAPPPLVYVEPNVAVVENAEFPVYFVENHYWSLRGGRWFRTDHWNGRWGQVDVSVVPGFIARRDHNRYVHYQGRPGDRRWQEPRVYAGPPPPPRPRNSPGDAHGRH